jgi:hypothetical protein
MGLLSKLFGVEKLESRGRQKSEANFDLVDELGAAITRAWTECGIALRPHMDGQNEEEREGHYILVMVEFFYFFVHMASRYALLILGQKGREKLMKELLPLLIDYAVKICFARLDRDYQQHIRGRLPIGISERDAHYGDGALKAPESGAKSEPVWVVTMLIRRVNIQSGKPPRDPQIMREVIKVAVDQVIALDLERRMIAVKHMACE